jgi:hypothetical protein
MLRKNGGEIAGLHPLHENVRMKSQTPIHLNLNPDALDMRKSASEICLIGVNI